MNSPPTLKHLKLRALKTLLRINANLGITQGTFGANCWCWSNAKAALSPSPHVCADCMALRVMCSLVFPAACPAMGYSVWRCCLWRIRKRRPSRSARRIFGRCKSQSGTTFEHLWTYPFQFFSQMWVCTKMMCIRPFHFQNDHIDLFIHTMRVLNADPYPHENTSEDFQEGFRNSLEPLRVVGNWWSVCDLWRLANDNLWKLTAISLDFQCMLHAALDGETGWGRRHRQLQAK